MPRYDSSKYRTPDGYTTDIAIFTIESFKPAEKVPPEMTLKIMLIKRAAKDNEGNPNYEGDKWALPGGFVQHNETACEAAKRELLEETGITGFHVQHFGVYDTPGRDKRGWIISNAFYAIVPEQYLEKRRANDDAADVSLFDMNEVFSLELAFDHDKIIREAYEIIKKEMVQTTIARNFLPEEFTLSELQRVLLTVGKDSKISSDSIFFAKAPKFPFLEKATDEKGRPKKTNRNSFRPSQLYWFNKQEVLDSIYH
ncbi:NUDIX domain-containing protein [Bacillus sp. CECT 9360]|uniref:NUDIX domain-containing protein n=1 Tax=Bacillus sp. CECT 9360 TaxID=2845821 RepID=UPI001E3130FE|nr:NUDIX domain-containing protein [Bacillus sp. CECT 9360]